MLFNNIKPQGEGEGREAIRHLQCTFVHFAFASAGEYSSVIGRSGQTSSFIYRRFTGNVTIRLVLQAQDEPRARDLFASFAPLGEIRALMCPECPPRPLNVSASRRSCPVASMICHENTEGTWLRGGSSDLSLKERPFTRVVPRTERISLIQLGVMAI